MFQNCCLTICCVLLLVGCKHPNPTPSQKTGISYIDDINTGFAKTDKIVEQMNTTAKETDSFDRESKPLLKELDQASDELRTAARTYDTKSFKAAKERFKEINAKMDAIAYKYHIYQPESKPK